MDGTAQSGTVIRLRSRPSCPENDTRDRSQADYEGKAIEIVKEKLVRSG
jgi:hypothetical protein